MGERIFSRRCAIPAGLDTVFLVQVEVAGHPDHEPARGLLERAVEEGWSFAIAPQVLAEFVHVVTDGRRFENPLSMKKAVQRGRAWWSAEEVRVVFPTDESVSLCLNWLEEHKLGRKRILDTQLASTYFCAGVTALMTGNANDFRVFGCFELYAPQHCKNPRSSDAHSPTKRAGFSQC